MLWSIANSAIFDVASFYLCTELSNTTVFFKLINYKILFHVDI